MRIFVGNLGLQISDDDLARAFQAFGTVNSAEVVMDARKHESRGYGFVEMNDNPEALATIRSLDDSLLNGRPILVNAAREIGLS